MRRLLFSQVFLLVIPFMMHGQPPGKHWEAIAYNEHSNELAVFSGTEFKDGKMQLTDSLWLYNGKWEVKDDNSIQGRWAHTLVYHNNKLHTYGGLTIGIEEQEKTLNDLYVFNGTWEKLAEGPHLLLPALYSSDGKLILAGQLKGSLNIFEMWEWNGKNLERILSADLKFKPDRVRSVMVNNDMILVYPSQGGLLFNNVNKNEITEVKGLPQRSKFGFTYSPADSSYFLFGGVNENKDFNNELWRIKDAKVEKIETAFSPAPKASCILLATGRGLILYGGVEKGGKLSNEIWRYENGKWNKW